MEIITDFRDLVGKSNRELSRVDPLQMNLLVAKSIPSLADLNIGHYRSVADGWARAVKERLVRVEPLFQETPGDWDNDINLFRLGVLCEFLNCEVGIAYKEEQKNITSIRYTDPSDLFVNGVMDTKRGTCGNLAALHVALGWRLGWPVSLACLKTHYICRYDDGNVTHNIEATYTGSEGFANDTDEQLIRKFQLPPIAISSGSDLRAITSRELLGVFIGLRARHVRDCQKPQEAELDYLVARHLFPKNRQLYIDSMVPIAKRGDTLFGPNEIGSPHNFDKLKEYLYGPEGWPFAREMPQSVFKGISFDNL